MHSENPKIVVVCYTFPGATSIQNKQSNRRKTGKFPLPDANLRKFCLFVVMHIFYSQTQVDGLASALKELVDQLGRAHMWSPIVCNPRNLLFLYLDENHVDASTTPIPSDTYAGISTSVSAIYALFFCKPVCGLFHPFCFTFLYHYCLASVNMQQRVQEDNLMILRLASSIYHFRYI